MIETLKNVVPASGMMIIADLEFTSWEGAQESGWSAPGQFREIVQIGAVRVDADDGFAERASFSVLVRPTINPELSDYFTALTGITNDALARDGVSLEIALAGFADFAGADVILSHGRDDLVVARDCALKDMRNPIAGADWRDLNPGLHAMTGQKLPSSALPAQFGLALAGSAHDALADSRALAMVLAHLKTEGRF